MSPIAVTLLTILAKWGPIAYEKAVAIYHSKDPTAADWDSLLVAVKSLNYDVDVNKSEGGTK